ncbi:amino acid ABC transporter substrate-binding protein [Synechocystis sp. FACHB-383]|uniref:amino acid ABC transporter substrate-binding protein n=1 Tax=Synechocystis sp. FACHB-383 TaxID=2692864 RepID=UPI0016831EA2|nr:amino acid ABC transporter substrate-binding protein [Synechocystis sp. FACHB-383]MBD2653495.1 amino acid ABC transporter substrate-binding protein [Synechocystis sp. FACHB-383]
MLLKSAVAWLALTFTTGLAAIAPVQAETVLERVARTGELRAGTRIDAVPFGFQLANGDIEGYGVDLMALIGLKLAAEKGKTITVDLDTVTLQNRFQAIASGELDIVCEATTITQDRLELVDFSAPFFISGAKFLMKQASVDGFQINGTLEGIPIAYIENTTTFDIIPQIYPLAQWVAVQDREEGIAQLDKGQVTAVVSDGILLVGELLKQGKDPADYALGPYQPITTELYACILPQGDRDWKRFVDEVISSTENHDLLQEWFNLDQSNVVRVDPL